MFFIPGAIIAAATFPGVVIHELAHQLFCRYFKIPVYEVCYFRFGNPSGYVLHGSIEKWPQHVLVSAGPFFINSLLGPLLAFSALIQAFEFQDASISWETLFLLWFGLSIAMHAIPSTGDAKAMWGAVSGSAVPALGKVIVAPIVGLIFLLALGSIVWLDLLYGVFVTIGFGKLCIALLA